MSDERIEITSSGLYALLREDFAEMMTATTREDRITIGAKLIRRVRQTNRIADTVTGNSTAELGQAVERLGQALVSQAHRRQKTTVRQTFSEKPSAGKLITAAYA